MCVPKLCGLLLAAGRSTRFGGHKGLALMADGVPMAVRSALNLQSVVDELICVVRVDDIELQDSFVQYGLHFITARDADQGMSASLKAGIGAAADAAGWMVGLGDMPLIQESTYKALSERFYEQGAREQGKSIVRPVFSFRGQQSKQGHPVIFPAYYREELIALSGDVGARSLLKRHTSRVDQVLVDDPGVLQDFDTPAEFSTLLK